MSTAQIHGASFFRQGGKWARSVIFKAGDYPDKGFNITAADLANIASTASRAPISIGHPQADSPLDGQLGWFEDITHEGEFLYGTPKPAPWLDQLLGDSFQVSVWLTGSPMRLVDVSIVSHPRVTEAVASRAFAVFCKEQRKGEPMEGNSEFWKGFFSFLGRKPDGDQTPANHPTVPPKKEETPDHARFAQMEAELTQYRQKEVQAAKDGAARFAEVLVSSGRITPAMKTEAESILCMAADADKDGRFSADSSGGLHARIVKFLEALPQDPKGLLKGQVGVFSGQAGGDKQVGGIDDYVDRKFGGKK
jgi:hypothetical protein